MDSGAMGFVPEVPLSSHRVVQQAEVCQLGARGQCRNILQQHLQFQSHVATCGSCCRRTFLGCVLSDHLTTDLALTLQHSCSYHQRMHI